MVKYKNTKKGYVKHDENRPPIESSTNMNIILVLDNAAQPNSQESRIISTDEHLCAAVVNRNYGNGFVPFDFNAIILEKIINLLLQFRLSLILQLHRFKSRFIVYHICLSLVRFTFSFSPSLFTLYTIDGFFCFDIHKNI